jgi:mevalonate kinase
MLLGEHAVLHGRLAMVCAVRERIHVVLRPRNDGQVRIESALGHFVTDLRDLKTPPPFSFVLTAVERHLKRLPSGFDLNIRSEFSEKIGFGSSAAVTVAAVAALHKLAGMECSRESIFGTALHVIRDVQGMGSGADAAASVHGGILTYRAGPLEIEPLTHRHPLTAVYSGHKTPTPEVVRQVDERRARSPGIFGRLFDLIEQCSLDAFDAVRRKDWPALGDLMNISQGLMDALGVSNATLSAIVYALRADEGILGSKISGSGLGDCAIGLGTVSGEDFPYDTLPVQMAEEGVSIEEA